MSSSSRRPPGTDGSAAPERRTIAVMPVVIVVSIACALVGLLSVGAGADPPSGPGTPVEATVGAIPGRTIPGGFLGLSLETSAIESYAGTDPAAPDPLFLHLVRALAPGASPVIRVGGNTSDWSWWPVSGMSRPPGVYITLDRTWVSMLAAVARSLGARLIPGLNLAADSTSVAATEAANIRAGVPDRSILAFELGNEPSIYGQYPWYRTPSGTGVDARAGDWDFAHYLADFEHVAGGVNVPALAGPSIGGPGWLPDLPALLAAEPRLRVVTAHQYPLQLCRTPPSSPRYPTIAHVLAPSASVGLAQHFAAAVATAHARGLTMRVDELNDVSCGAAAWVSQRFASALWALDTLFAFAEVGADGVQIHTFPGAGYELFPMRRTAAGSSAKVNPKYYGLLMFASAAPAGSRLLTVTAAAGSALSLYATLGRDARTRVVLINKDGSHARTVRVRVPTAAPRATATVAQLRAPSLSASSGVTLAGRSFGARTSTGHLTGRREVTTVAPDAGRYSVTLPPGSATLLTVG